MRSSIIVRSIVLAVVILTGGATSSLAQRVLERTVQRGQWKIEIYRDVWTDELRAFASSPPATMTKPGDAAFGLIVCAARKATLALQWPREFESYIEKALMRWRIGSGPVTATEWTDGRNQTKFPARSVLTYVNGSQVDWLPSMRAAPYLAIGFNEQDAALISLTGFSEAWFDMERFCENGTAPTR